MKLSQNKYDLFAAANQKEGGHVHESILTRISKSSRITLKEVL